MRKKLNKVVRELYLYSDGGSVNNGNKDKSKKSYGAYCSLIVKPKNGKLVKTFCAAEENVTNNMMELKGAIKGIEWLSLVMKNKHPNELLDLTIISDSQYLIKGCSEWLENWKKRNWKDASKKPIKNMETWKYIDELLKNEQINFNFKWVRGHSGKSIRKEDDMDSYFNERCDTLLTEELKPYRDYYKENK